MTQDVFDMFCLQPSEYDKLNPGGAAAMSIEAQIDHSIKMREMREDLWERLPGKDKHYCQMLASGAGIKPKEEEKNNEEKTSKD